MKTYITAFTVCGGIFAITILAPIKSQAQYVLGSFQGSSDPTDAGWINANNSDSITTDPNSSFVAAGVPGDPLSLQVNGTGGFGEPAIQLGLSPTQITALNANSWLTFTFSVPTGSSTSGYSQIYNVILNAPGTGYNYLGNGNVNPWSVNSQAEGSTGSNQNGEPNFYFYSGDPSLFSETVTINYSSFLSAIEAGGESYVQLLIQGNDSGGPTDMDFNNVVLSTQPFGVDAVPEPATLALAGLGGISMLFLRRRKG